VPVGVLPGVTNRLNREMKPPERVMNLHQRLNPESFSDGRDTSRAGVARIQIPILHGGNGAPDGETVEDFEVFPHRKGRWLRSPVVLVVLAGAETLGHGLRHHNASTQ